jgi:serine/threonine protein kinase
VTPSQRACLSDFGLASSPGTRALRWTSTSVGIEGGTLRWQPPEHLAFDSEDENVINTSASDMYSFGCVSYEVGYLSSHDAL